MNCPHCGKVIIVKLAKDNGKAIGGTGMAGEIGALLAQINDDEITGPAADFISKTRERFDTYGEDTRLSDKQRSWLQDIAEGKTR